jgi:hypothetical protein
VLKQQSKFDQNEVTKENFNLNLSKDNMMSGSKNFIKQNILGAARLPRFGK